MRVTKTIREYIEKEVTARIHPKYATEEAEAKRQYQKIEQFLEDCSEAAKRAYNDYFEIFFPQIATFATDDRDTTNLSFYKSTVVSITDRLQYSSVHHWRDRERAEVQEKVQDIIITLELGGDKATLMEMLDKIGKGE